LAYEEITSMSPYVYSISGLTVNKVEEGTDDQKFWSRQWGWLSPYNAPALGDGFCRDNNLTVLPLSQSKFVE